MFHPTKTVPPLSPPNARRVQDHMADALLEARRYYPEMPKDEILVMAWITLACRMGVWGDPDENGRSELLPYKPDFLGRDRYPHRPPHLATRAARS